MSETGLEDALSNYTKDQPALAAMFRKPSTNSFTKVVA